MKDNLIENFNTDDLIKKSNAAVEIIDMKASYEELIEFLKSDNANLINAALIKINQLETKKDSFLFVSKLVGNETKIREITSFRLLDFIKNSAMSGFFQSKEVMTVLLKGVDDVNPSVCRNVIASFEFIEDSDFLLEKIIEKINTLSDEIALIKDVKSHENSKKIFNLYWNLEALGFLTKVFQDKLEPFKDDILELINKNKNNLNYQIREKSALICFNLMQVFAGEEFESFKKSFKTDENFYVRLVFIR